MHQELLVICFDINSYHEENNKQNKNNIEQLPESPDRIMKEFISNHKSLKPEKKEIDKSKFSYKFNVNLPEETSFQLLTINDLSCIHEICVQADAYLVFINLEDDNLEKKLEFVIKYINEFCSGTKVYIIGLYKDKNFVSFQDEELENLINKKYLNYEYFKIKYNMNNNNKEHICLLDLSHKKNKNDNNKRKLNEENYEYKLPEIIEKIIINIY